MKSFIYPLFSLLLAANLGAQDTWSYRYSLDLPNTIFTGMHLDDNGEILLSGVVRDTLDGQLQHGVAKVSPEGVLLWAKINADSTARLEPWRGSDASDSIIYHVGYALDTNGMKGLVQAINFDGIPVWTVKQDGFMSNISLFKYTDVLLLNDRLFVLGYTFRETEEDPRINDLILAEYDPITGDLLSSSLESYYNNNLDYIYSAIKSQGDTTLLALGNRSNYATGSVNYIGKPVFKSYSLVDGQEWQDYYISSTERKEGSEYDFISTPDGGFIIATVTYTQVVSPNGNSTRYPDCFVYKIGQWGEQVWQRHFKPNPFTGQRFHKIIEAAEGDGYVIIGNASQYYPEADPETENVIDYGGIIAKVSPEGDSLWARVIIHPDLPGFSERHEFNDIIQLPDGYFLVAGESRSPDTEPSQQGWLVKLDPYGCLVPGCHLISNTDTPNAASPRLLLYPNPVRDQLNVYLGAGKLSPNARLRIMGLDGRTYRQEASRIADATYVLDVSALPAGTYYAQLWDDGIVVSEVFQVVR